MNLLAHAFLSFHHPETLVGNMISDFVKGKKKYDYPVLILNGINLHRAIDTFTDAHKATRLAATYLKPAAGAYAGAFVDVVYDHFLANNATQFSSDSALETFAGETYAVLLQNRNLLPDKFAGMFPYMQSQNWLYNYKHIQGVQNGFAGVACRAKYIESSEETFALFEKHYYSLQDCYRMFFPAVREFAYAKWKEIL